MNSLKLFLTSFKKNIFSFVLIILEISSLFLAENYMYSVLKEREMLNAPFAPLLNENTILAYDTSMFLGSSGLAGSRNEIVKNISGNYKIYDVKIYSDINISVASISDEIYEKLALPLSSGSYGTAEKGAVGTIRTKTGENKIEIEGKTLTLNVCGLLTEMTYIPEMKNFNSADMTIADFYSSSINAANTIITSRSAIKGFEDYFTNSFGFLIEFEDNVEENIAAIRKKASVITAENIIINTENALESDRERFLPLISAITFIVLIGIVCISVITFKENELNNGIMWLCGYSKSGIIGMHSINIALMTLLSAVISAVVFLVLKSSRNELVIGLSLSLGNLVLTLLTAAFLIGVSAIIPVLRSLRTSPVEYLRRAK